MKKLLFLWQICILSALSHSLEFKGSPIDIQINEDKSFLVLQNDEYDFSVYSVSVKNGNLGKKDVSDTSYELNESYAKEAEADCDLQKILEREKVRRENKFKKKQAAKLDFIYAIPFT